jgi:glucosamine-6-phosphate deaminase
VNAPKYGRKEKDVTGFEFGLSKWAPFQDRETCERVRRIRREDICKHANPDLRIEVVADDQISHRRVTDIFRRIKSAAEADRRLVLILPNPHPQYIKVAHLINTFQVNCRNLFIFNMDEWADEEGNTAPESWPNGLMYGMLNYFYYRIEEKLRPPREQIQGPTTRNIDDFAGMIEDVGGVDVCYGGIGWSGHLAFIEPDAPEFSAELEDWRRMGPRIVTLSPFTIAQSCLDADYGLSGNWAWVPPRAATIGPAQVLSSRLRSSWNSFTISGTQVSWQRFTVRLAAHGPVTPRVPASMLQLAPSELYISESIAANIEPHRELSWYS